jgi:hypothetical protein
MESFIVTLRRAFCHFSFAALILPCYVSHRSRASDTQVAPKRIATLHNDAQCIVLETSQRED